MLEFDKLDIDKQIEFINSELKKDKNTSVTKLCKKFGFNKNTLISRFNKANYFYDSDNRKYIKSKKNNLDKKVIEEVAATLEKNIESDIKELIKNKKDILYIIKQYKNNSNKVSREDKEMIIDTSIVSEQVQNHNFKVYKNIIKEIQDLQKQYKYFKLTDLVSTALHEYYLKHNKNNKAL